MLISAPPSVFMNAQMPRMQGYGMPRNPPHLLPQVLQLLASLRRFAQMPLQQVSPGPQAMHSPSQTPATQA